MRKLTADAKEWVMVPREPDLNMVEAGEKAGRDHIAELRASSNDFQETLEGWWPSPARVYRAMLAASPTPPVRVVTVKEVEKAAQAFFTAKAVRGECYNGAMRAALEALGLQVER